MPHEALTRVVLSLVIVLNNQQQVKRETLIALPETVLSTVKGSRGRFVTWTSLAAPQTE